MSYGSDQWQDWVLNEDKSLPLLKAAYDKGINSWDTADVYSNGESERIIAKAIEKYNIPREKLVIMTKLFFAVPEAPNELRFGQSEKELEKQGPKYVNQSGLSRKHIFDAVEKSLARLQTSYIDVLQIHRYDPTVSCEEVMEALHGTYSPQDVTTTDCLCLDIVKCGKVRYIGASSMWTYQFQTLQFTAKLNGWTQFISMQNFYNLVYREEEREMMKYLKETGVGSIPWSPLARGLLSKPWDDSSSTRSTTDTMLTAFKNKTDVSDKEIVERTLELSKKYGKTMSQIATAWILAKPTVTAPIVGFRDQSHMDDLIAALDINLSAEDIRYLEEPYIPKAVFGHE
ncbi:Versiconal hemiacetal acetate reductase [Neolecta irregularis DAH-3]|uniref:Versiconal hemiacetal acetate reductase n=1 Tax=Neolecta irregularis (strain DAH-3) TaxID=1198029 RepID=A0A1U7LNS0_NEOID|nr:Versiconal hemiacetal acetate reductase [Neolecta irregularis DAH-3]|eukprot:OLL24171.1 Versiconal hemiacetal acetate reductase [Neolecta irregularis DAH-3]